MSWAEQAAWVTSNVVTEYHPRDKRLRSPGASIAGLRPNVHYRARAATPDGYFGIGSGAQFNDLTWSSAAP